VSHELRHNINAWKTETLTVLPREHSLFPGLETLDGISSGISLPFAAASAAFFEVAIALRGKVCRITRNKGGTAFV
jgi:hypothetical protein